MASPPNPVPARVDIFTTGLLYMFFCDENRPSWYRTPFPCAVRDCTKISKSLRSWRLHVQRRHIQWAEGVEDGYNETLRRRAQLPEDQRKRNGPFIYRNGLLFEYQKKASEDLLRSFVKPMRKSVYCCQIGRCGACFLTRDWWENHVMLRHAEWAKGLEDWVSCKIIFSTILCFVCHC